MSQVDLESELFQNLLTDALRAGPGSPEWHQAVGALRASGAKNADEYQLLVRAREDLESGRDYRAVKAGSGFTRKVMEGLEAEGDGKAKGIPSANIIALLSAGVILAVVVVLAVALLKNAPSDVDKGRLEQLRGMYFVTPVVLGNFDAGGEIGSEWKMAGEVALKPVKNVGLSPATTQPSADKREYKAGAIVRSESVPPGQAMMVDVSFKVRGVSDAVVPQVFVSEGAVDAVKGTSERELVWLMRGGQAQVVLPDGTIPATGEKLDGKRPHTVNVKIRFDKEMVIVESGEKKLWEGAHKLSGTAPRYIGVRFLRKVGDATDGVGLSSISVLKGK